MSIFKVSLPGIDVNKARPHETVVDSDFPNHKIKKNQNPTHRGLIQLGLNNTYAVGTTTVYTMAHGYNYTPMVWATIADNSTTNIFGFQPYASGVQQVDVKTDSKNMYVVVIASLIPWTPNIILNISYALFADNGARN